MTFLPRTLRLNAADMAAFILAIPHDGFTWSPRGVTWHNTGAPSLKQWEAYQPAVREAWGDNYDHYCKFNQHWHSGPHFCATPEGWSFVLCEPRANGVHASCFNSDHFGVETVGDFRPGSDDPMSELGMASMRAAANIIAALCIRFGWAPRSAVNFHRQCARDGHPCPGPLVSDEFALSLVEKRMAALGHDAPPGVATPKLDPHTLAGLQACLNELGAMPPLTVDGDIGRLSRIAIAAFQKAHGCSIDGIAGPETIAAVEAALTAKG